MRNLHSHNIYPCVMHLLNWSAMYGEISMKQCLQSIPISCWNNVTVLFSSHIIQSVSMVMGFFMLWGHYHQANYRLWGNMDKVFLQVSLLKKWWIHFLSGLLPRAPNTCKAFTSCCKTFSYVGLGQAWAPDMAHGQDQVLGIYLVLVLEQGSVAVLGMVEELFCGGCGCWSSWPWASGTSWGACSFCQTWFGFYTTIVIKCRQCSCRANS